MNTPKKEQAKHAYVDTATDIATEKAGEQRVGGWQCRSSEVVYDNPWIQIRHEEVTRPNGTEGIYGVVHFKGWAIGVVAIDDDDQIYLVKQSRYPNNEVTLELPEGGGALDEAPLVSAQRELKEETGATAAHWELLMEMRTSNSVTDEVAYVYLATGISQGQQKLDDTEDIELIHMPFAKALDLVMAGEIKDAISVAAILKVAQLRSSS